MGEAPPGAATGDGATRRRRRVHPGLVAAAVLAVMALPLLAFTKTPSHKSKAATQRTPATQSTDMIPTEPIATELATTEATTTVPLTEATTSEPATTEATTTTAAKPSTTVAKPKAVAPAPKPAAKPAAAPAPRPAAPPASGNSQSGQGTWYSYKPGGCANNNLPKGTVVHVTNTANGRSATCVVNDTGGFSYPRILDMDKSVFAQLADPSAGVIPIVISW